MRAINFGMFSWMVVPLLSALKWLFGFLGNYGWAIVVLTILLNLVLFYPRHRSVVAMRKMQAIQPEMKAIQDRYANLKATDPAKQKMNTEVMNLYRERGVNPASGCVPMLLTMPVLLAFYSLLSMSIELRGAPFVGWIHDLSAPDPYFVIPLLMGITMFWQQRISPTVRRPDAAARDDDHADHVHGDDGVLAERRRVVLDGQSALGHRAAVSDEPIDWTARGCDRAARQVTIGSGVYVFDHRHRGVRAERRHRHGPGPHHHG